MKWIINIINMGLEARKPVLGVYEQPKHLHRLISAFVIHLLENII